MRNAAERQAQPTNGKRDVVPEVIKDMQARDVVGTKKYGTTLQTHNGRDALLDAYQEVLDLAVYLKQELMQREDN
ncbi:MAG: hypothetical protein DRJ03_01235 [Chloroflexi bacterium]|nr:MAG: hypothetical protein DRJ03_01235 [Chloroflexota bacterium]